MLKVCFKVIIFLIPIFVVIGVIRLAISGFDPDRTFLPTVDEMILAFNQFPNISTDIQKAVVDLQTSIGFFDGIQRFLNLIWTVLSAPVRILVWVFQVLFGVEVRGNLPFNPIITVPIV